MRIIVFSSVPWDDTNATGNTLSNFFGGEVWNDDEFYNIYLRTSLPSNNICKNYYQISLVDILKNYFFKEKIGVSFEIKNKNDRLKNTKKINEKKIINFIHKFSLNFVYFIEDYSYRSKKWLNKKFKKYISNINPDIFYAPMNNYAILKPIIEYLKENTNSKIVLLLTDDLYGDLDNKSYFRRKKLKFEYEQIINMADKIYAISDELKFNYEKIFGKKMDILRKGCKFDFDLKKKANDTLKFVYAGNLLYGRETVLLKVASAIFESNKRQTKKAVLDIFTGSIISDELNKKFSKFDCVNICGKKSYDQIKIEMNKADYNLHVESFEKKHSEYVKYSFSTKIIDCLQSGSSFVCIGPSYVSSIKYAKKIPGAYVINDENNINDDIEKIILNSNNIVNDSKLIRKFAINNHDINMNQQNLKHDFLCLKSYSKGD